MSQSIKRRKRLVSGLIPWIGGKGRLASTIIEKFPAHSCYVEAFCGAAAIFFAKQPSEVEVLNDINGELVNLYRVIQHHLEEFVLQFKWALTSRQVYEWEKKKPPETLTDIQRAARFYYLQKLSFGGRVDGQNFGTATTSGSRLNLLRLEEDLSQAHLRLHQVYVENLPWHEVIAKYDRPHTLFYLDPPYWETEGYGVDFGIEQYQRMAELAKSVEGSMLISLNDHPEMRRIFDGLYMDNLEITYTVGGGSGSVARELLIWNEHCEKGRRLTGNLTLF
ncbi:MAG: DNA adenine methylase [Pseudomonadota bacterium]